MKFSCEKSFLLGAINTSSRAASVKSAVPSLEGLLIEAYNSVRITGYNLRTGIRTELPADITEEGAIILNAKLFGDIVRKLPDDIVTISSDSNLSTKIVSGMSEFTIMGISSDEYPELPAVENHFSIELEQNKMASMIAETNFAVSENEARPIHTGTLFEAENGILTMVAVDGYRLALRREGYYSDRTEKISFVVPGAALSEVQKIAGDTDDRMKITIGVKHVMFTIGGTLLISRRLEGEFLNYRNSIPKSSRISVMADRRSVINTVDRVSLIISDKLKTPVRCVFGDGVLKASTATPLGRANDECPVEGSGENLEIGFNNKYLLDALKAAPSDKILIQVSSGIAPCIIVPAEGETNFLYMILPVRLKANEG